MRMISNWSGKDLEVNKKYLDIPRQLMRKNNDVGLRRELS